MIDGAKVIIFACGMMTGVVLCGIGLIFFAGI